MICLLKKPLYMIINQTDTIILHFYMKTTWYLQAKHVIDSNLGHSNEWEGWDKDNSIYTFIGSGQAMVKCWWGIYLYILMKWNVIIFMVLWVLISAFTRMEFAIWAKALIKTLIFSPLLMLRLYFSKRHSNPRARPLARICIWKRGMEERYMG